MPRWTAKCYADFDVSESDREGVAGEFRQAEWKVVAKPPAKAGLPEQGLPTCRAKKGGAGFYLECGVTGSAVGADDRDGNRKR